jgi:hypothetical protein
MSTFDSADSTETTEELRNLLLAVDVPEEAKGGETFEVSLDQRHFEVTVPEGDTLSLFFYQYLGYSSSFFCIRNKSK